MLSAPFQSHVYTVPYTLYSLYNGVKGGKKKREKGKNPKKAASLPALFSLHGR